MTRINIGILPAELCDEHLIAEYRELPRMRAFAIKRLEHHGGTGPRPELPTLGTGHMAYFIPYGRWLRDRWHALVDEMLRRSVRPTLVWRDYPTPFDSGTVPTDHETLARPLLIERIRTRLAGMTKITWTGVQRPAWSTMNTYTVKRTGQATWEIDGVPHNGVIACLVTLETLDEARGYFWDMPDAAWRADALTEMPIGSSQTVKPEDT